MPAPADEPMPTVAVHVRPGASRTSVGGERAGALVVRVSARAVDGAATEAALRAIAEAFGLRRRDVRLVRGATSRHKVVAIAAAPEVVAARCRQLMGLPADEAPGGGEH